jgi:hypothetical protein
MKSSFADFIRRLKRRQSFSGEEGASAACSSPG